MRSALNFWRLKTLRIFALAYAAWLASAPGAYASPWAREPGELFVISRMSYFSADLATFDQPGADERRFERLEGASYLEYGLTRRITLGAKIVYGSSWLTAGPQIQAANGFSDIDAFGQYEFRRTNRDAASVRLGVTRPSRFGAGARAALQSDGVDAELAALYGRTLIDRGVKVFATADVAYRKRFSDAADQLRPQLAIGVEPSRAWLLLAEAHGEFSLRNENNDGVDFDVVKIQPSIVWRATPYWGLQAGLSEEITGRNLDLGRTVFLGLWTWF